MQIFSGCHSQGGTPLSLRGTPHASLPRGELGRAGRRVPAEPADGTPLSAAGGAPSTPARGGGANPHHQPLPGQSPVGFPSPGSSRHGESPGAGVHSPRSNGGDPESPGGGGGGGGGEGVAMDNTVRRTSSATPPFTRSYLLHSFPPPLAQVIWGTNVNVADAMERFRSFIVHYGKESDPAVATASASSGSGGDSDSGDDLGRGDGSRQPVVVGRGLYLRALEAIRSTQKLNLAVDCQHLASFPQCRRLYAQLVQYPQEIVPIMDLVVHQL